MNSLVSFIMKMLGLGDQSTVEKLIKSVLLGNKPADGSAPRLARTRSKC